MQQIIKMKICKPNFYVPCDLYLDTKPEIILFPPRHGDVDFKYLFLFEKDSQDYVDCYIMYIFY